MNSTFYTQGNDEHGDGDNKMHKKMHGSGLGFRSTFNSKNATFIAAIGEIDNIKLQKWQRRPHDNKLYKLQENTKLRVQ